MRMISGLACAGCFWAGAVLAQSPVSVAIATQSPGYAIPADFSGLSFETGSERSGNAGTSGYMFSGANTQLITLFQNVALKNIRMGGGSVDDETPPGLGSDGYTGIDNLFNFAQQAGVNVIYSVRLLGTATVSYEAGDASIAQYIWQHYQPLLTCFAIGNEPDWNSYHYPTGPDPAITGYPSYLADWRNFAAAITNAASGAKFAGPDTGAYNTATYYNGESWTQHFADDEKSSGIVTLIAQHFYVGASPGSATAQQAWDAMLSPGWDTITNQWLYDNNLAPVVADGLPYRLTESNDYLGGVTNASNAFASALWALDYMHWWAAHNCAGVNFHNKQWIYTDTIYLDPFGNYQINPKGYGIKAFDVGGHGNVEPLTLTNANGLNLTAYAVGNTTNLYVTIINKEHGTGARDAAVTIMPNGLSSGSVAAMFLTAPGGNVGATNGMTLGGATIANNAPWLGQWSALNPLTNGQCTVTVPAASAAVVRIAAAALDAPVIVQDLPAQVILASGKTYTYLERIYGALPLSYQWYNGAMLLAGQTNASYTLTAGSLGSTTYSVVITNVYGAVTSTVSTLTIISRLTDAYATTVLGYGPAGYWPLQETNAPAPANLETNYGTLGKLGNACYATINASDVAFGQPGALAGSSDAAIGFNGAGNGGTPDSYAFVPRVSPALTLQPPLTLEAWVNSSYTSFGDIMGEGGNGLNSPINGGNAGGIRMSWGGAASGANLQLYIFNGSGLTRPSISTPANSLTLGQWHHCVATFDGTNAYLYVDGTQAASGPLTMALDTWSPLTIGAGFWQGTKPQRAYNGLEDEVAIYSSVLTATQIANHHLAGVNASSNYVQTVLNDHPLLYYRMDDPTYFGPNPTLYPIAVNYGSAPANGTYPSGIVPGGVPGPPMVGLGTNSVAAPVNGVFSCVDAGNDLAFNRTNALTAMIWFKTYPSDARMQTIMSHGGNTSWVINLVGTNGFLNWSSGAGSVTSTNILNDGNWHFVAGVYDGSHNYLYVDGALNNSGAASGSSVGNTNDDVLLGGDPDYTLVGSNERYFAGVVAQAAFFTNALTLAQVQMIYQSASTLPPEFFTVQKPGNNQMQLNWTYGTLQSATNVIGPYGDVTGASPPYTITTTNAQQFYRVRKN